MNLIIVYLMLLITLQNIEGILNQIDFIFVKAVSISAGIVTISLDGSEQIIKLLEGEAFASKIAPGAAPTVHISDTATVEYMTGT